MRNGPATRDSIIKGADNVAVRPWSSAIVKSRIYDPKDVSSATVATKVKVFPLPTILWAVEPPMVLRFAVTLIPVLGGSTTGSTVTVSVTFVPGYAEVGTVVTDPDSTPVTTELWGNGSLATKSTWFSLRSNPTI